MLRMLFVTLVVGTKAHDDGARYFLYDTTWIHIVIRSIAGFVVRTAILDLDGYVLCGSAYITRCRNVVKNHVLQFVR